MENLGKFGIDQKNVICYCIPDIVEEDDGVKLIVLLNDGKLMEINENEVLSKLQFDFPVNSAKEISIFHNYQPKLKYYIVLIQDILLVVKRKDGKLVLIKKILNVLKYQVTDYYNIGKPHVVIFLKNKTQPLVTDFVDNLESKECNKLKKISGLTSNLLIQMNNVQSRIKELEKKIEYQQFVIAEHAVEEISNVPLPKPSYNNLVRIQLDEDVDIPEPKVSTRHLHIGESTIKLHLNHLIIIVPVSHRYELPLAKFEMYIDNKELVVIKTNLFLLQDTLELSTVLKCDQTGYLVGVTVQPYQIKSNLKFNCIVRYVMNSKPYQCYLSEISLRSQDITDYSLIIKNKIELNDILTLVVTNQETKIYIQTTSTNDFCRILRDSGFTEFSNSYCNNNRSSYYNNMYIKLNIKEEITILYFYSVDINQLLIFLQYVQSKIEIKFNAELFDIDEAVESLTEELKLVKNLLFQHIDGESSQQEDINESIKKLFIAEIKSLKSVSSLL